MSRLHVYGSQRAAIRHHRRADAIKTWTRRNVVGYDDATQKQSRLQNYRVCSKEATESREAEVSIPRGQKVR